MRDFSHADDYRSEKRLQYRRFSILLTYVCLLHTGKLVKNVKLFQVQTEVWRRNVA
jgi:hypothetical protein